MIGDNHKFQSLLTVYDRESISGKVVLVAQLQEVSPILVFVACCLLHYELTPKYY